MVILVKSWRGNIDVKLFTTIGHKSWLVNLLRKMLKIFQDIPKELLRKSWEQFPGNSQELVMKNFSLEIPKHFHEFCRHFLRFFCRIGNKKFPGIGGKKFLGQSYEKILGMGCKKFLGPGSSKWVTRNFLEQLSTFSQIPENFHGISTKQLLGQAFNYKNNVIEVYQFYFFLSMFDISYGSFCLQWKPQSF